MAEWIRPTLAIWEDIRSELCPNSITPVVIKGSAALSCFDGMLARDKIMLKDVKNQPFTVLPNAPRSNGFDHIQVASKSGRCGNLLKVNCLARDRYYCSYSSPINPWQSFILDMSKQQRS